MRARACVSSPGISVCQRIGCVPPVICAWCLYPVSSHHDSLSWVCSVQEGSSPSAVARKPKRKVSKWLFSSDHTPEVHLLNAGRLGHTSLHSKGAPPRLQLR